MTKINGWDELSILSTLEEVARESRGVGGQPCVFSTIPIHIRTPTPTLLRSRHFGDTALRVRRGPNVESQNAEIRLDSGLGTMIIGPAKLANGWTVHHKTPLTPGSLIAPPRWRARFRVGGTDEIKPAEKPVSEVERGVSPGVRNLGHHAGVSEASRYEL